MENDDCILCKKPLGDSKPVATLRQKGCNSLLNAIRERDDTLQVQVGQRIHADCRRDYVSCKNKAGKRKQAANDNEATTRGSGICYDYKHDCLFCGKHIPEYMWSGKKSCEKVFKVRTKSFQESISTKCYERNDAWGQEVLARIEFSQDLVASDTVYHQLCSTQFRNGRAKLCENTETPEKKQKRVGRQVHLSREDAFQKVVQYVEDSTDEHSSLSDLVDIMRSHLGSELEPFTTKHMKRRLNEHFGERLFVTEMNGKQNVVTLRQTASKILSSMYSMPKNDDPEVQKMLVIKTSAELLKSDIKGAPQRNATMYPSCADIDSPEKCADYLPDSLLRFLETVMGNKTLLKNAAIGQALMQAVCPKSIVAPLQIMLAIQMHLQFGSRLLVDSLNEMGFCSSYNEVQQFERSAAITQNTDIPGYTPGKFVQFMADNVDHNCRTIDGLNTFHGMGIVAAVTPGTRFERVIPRIKVTSADVTAVSKIDIHFKSTGVCETLTYKPLPLVIMEDKTYNVDLLWKMSWLLRPNTPLWNGTMQTIHEGSFPGKSSVMFLPLIDMEPSNESCIYSTLLFIADQSQKYDVSPIVTFDQPLWWKAQKIVETEPHDSPIKKTVLRLGGLHVQMSFLGSIGHLMTDSGLKELLQTVYAENTVPHMLTGKAIARAIRGHVLAEIALTALLVTKTFDVDLPEHALENSQGDSGHINEEIISHEIAMEDQIPAQTSEKEDGIETPPTNSPSYEELEQAMKLFDALINNEHDVNTAAASTVVQQAADRLKTAAESLKDCRTANLWLQYMNMLDTLKMFIKSERTGNWLLHLQSIADMLPYFAAAGHHSYTKSAHVYLTKMLELEQTNPRVYRWFMDGYHVIRRSDRYWAGLSSDLVIEQTLMRSIKTVGGLTRGRGMDEDQRALWIMSRPACAEINEQMQMLTGKKHISSEQHQECAPSRMARDANDIRTMISFLKDRDPFTDERNLRSIASGVVADAKVNADQALEIGRTILSNMTDTKVEEFKFRKKHQSIIMNDNASITVGTSDVTVDPQLLFQRLVSVAQGAVPTDELERFFSHELCTYPPALFENMHQMREASKAVLGNEIAKMQGNEREHQQVDTSTLHVIDGGSLLHKIVWPRGRTYNEICHMYVTYLTEKYDDCVVVFDGYESGPSTKDNTHRRRTGGQMGAEVKVDGDLIMNTKKQKFLLNKQNKQQFIHLLSSHLTKANIQTMHAETDADVLIAKTAIECSESRDTVVIGEDTDILILLCYYAKDSNNKVFLQSGGRKPRCLDISAIRYNLGPEVCENILFIHAILGCDTVSKPSGIGKSAALKLFKKSTTFRQCAHEFNKLPNDISKEDLVTYGEKALICLYAGETNTVSINQLRVTMFLNKTASNSVVIDPKCLPPTKDACKYHSYRVYLQILQWKDIHEDPEEYGWRLSDITLEPVKNDMPPAPENILKVVHCSCKTNCKTMACSCRKLAIPCSMICRNCNDLCSNASRPAQIEM